MKVSFAAFFMMWAERMRWDVPDIHIAACHWLEHRGDVAVLRCFRGFGKSTILAVYNAWLYYCDQTFRILHQGDQDGTAYKTSRDTKSVLSKHPLTAHLASGLRGDVAFWWVPGSTDERNPSMQAAGILSNITSSRADEVQNDDVEVPRNIGTPEAREKLRYRLSEQTHILVPGGRTLYIGTPHTHDSLYDEVERMGADCLTIKMFEHEFRIEPGDVREFVIPFSPEIVFAGIGEFTRVLEQGKDCRYQNGTIQFAEPPTTTIDCYAGCAWPERFTIAELVKRRQKCRTINEWDSQYQLHSKPIGSVRLDPERLLAYDMQPRIVTANNEAAMFLGGVQIVGASTYWDVSLGKIQSDASALSVVFTDHLGRLYWHVCAGLSGDLDSQCKDVCDYVAQYSLGAVTVETNGPGGFVPASLRAHLAKRDLACGVIEQFQATNKQKRILDAIEAPLSSQFLWAHVDVLNGPLWDQMKDFNPAVTDQPDDYLDSGAGAIKATPVRLGVGHLLRKSNSAKRDHWEPDAGDFEYQIDNS